MQSETKLLSGGMLCPQGGTFFPSLLGRSSMRVMTGHTDEVWEKQQERYRRDTLWLDNYVERKARASLDCLFNFQTHFSTTHSSLRGLHWLNEVDGQI